MDFHFLRTLTGKAAEPDTAQEPAQATGEPQATPERADPDALGRPELNNPFGTPESRRIQDEIDEAIGRPIRKRIEDAMNGLTRAMERLARQQVKADGD